MSNITNNRKKCDYFLFSDNEHNLPTAKTDNASKCQGDLSQQGYNVVLDQMEWLDDKVLTKEIDLIESFFPELIASLTDTTKEDN